MATAKGCKMSTLTFFDHKELQLKPEVTWKLELFTGSHLDRIYLKSLKKFRHVVSYYVQCPSWEIHKYNSGLCSKYLTLDLATFQIICTRLEVGSTRMCISGVSEWVNKVRQGSHQLPVHNIYKLNRLYNIKRDRVFSGQRPLYLIRKNDQDARTRTRAR